MATDTNPAAEQLVQELAELIHQAADDDIREMAQLLTTASDAQLFGDTEFRIRELTLRIARRAYQARLDQKKT